MKTLFFAWASEKDPGKIVISHPKHGVVGEWRVESPHLFGGIYTAIKIGNSYVFPAYAVMRETPMTKMWPVWAIATPGEGVVLKDTVDVSEFGRRLAFFDLGPWTPAMWVKEIHKDTGPLNYVDYDTAHYIVDQQDRVVAWLPVVPLVLGSTIIVDPEEDEIGVIDTRERPLVVRTLFTLWNRIACAYEGTIVVVGSHYIYVYRPNGTTGAVPAEHCYVEARSWTGREALITCPDKHVHIRIADDGIVYMVPIEGADIGPHRRVAVSYTGVSIYYVRYDTYRMFPVEGGDYV